MEDGHPLTIALYPLPPITLYPLLSIHCFPPIAFHLLLSISFHLSLSISFCKWCLDAWMTPSGWTPAAIYELPVLPKTDQSCQNKNCNHVMSNFKTEGGCVSAVSLWSFERKISAIVRIWSVCWAPCLAQPFAHKVRVTFLRAACTPNVNGLRRSLDGVRLPCLPSPIHLPRILLTTETSLGHL